MLKPTLLPESAISDDASGEPSYVRRALIRQSRVDALDDGAAGVVGMFALPSASDK